MTKRPVPNVKTLWAFVGADPEDGIVSTAVEINGMVHHLPLVGCMENRLPHMRELASEVTRLTGKRVQLIRFSGAEVLEVFGETVQ